VPVQIMDYGLTAGVWAAGLWIAMDIPGDRNAIETLSLYSLVLVPFATFLWFPLRLVMPIGRLADTHLRESLALTGLNARRFILHSLRPEFLRALLPTLTLTPAAALILALLLLPSLVSELVLALVAGLVYGLLYSGMVIFACSIAFECLRRLCLPGARMAAALAWAYGWSLGGAAIVAFVLWFGRYPIPAILVSGAVLAEAIDLLFSRLRRAEAIYYQFELPESEDEPAAPSSGRGMRLQAIARARRR